MSKSYDNCIDLADSADEVRKKVMTMLTDPARKRREDKGHPEVCPVFFHHQIVNKSQTDTIGHECREAVRGCVECKKEMAEKLNEFLEPVRKRREAWIKKKSQVKKILEEGRKKATKVAGQTLQETMKAMGLRK